MPTMTKNSLTIDDIKALRAQDQALTQQMHGLVDKLYRNLDDETQAINLKYAQLRVDRGKVREQYGDAIDVLLEKNEAERETRVEWGRERQTALDQLRWVSSALKPFAEYGGYVLKARDNEGDANLPDRVAIRFNDFKITVQDIEDVIHWYNFGRGVPQPPDPLAAAKRAISDQIRQLDLVIEQKRAMLDEQDDEYDEHLFQAMTGEMNFRNGLARALEHIERAEAEAQNRQIVEFQGGS